MSSDLDDISHVVLPPREFKAVEQFFQTIHDWNWEAIYRAVIPFTVVVLFGIGMLTTWFVGIAVANWLVPPSANLQNLTDTLGIIVMIGFVALAVGYSYFLRKVFPPLSA